MPATMVRRNHGANRSRLRRTDDGILIVCILATGVVKSVLCLETAVDLGPVSPVRSRQGPRRARLGPFFVEFAGLDCMDCGECYFRL